MWWKQGARDSCGGGSQGQDRKWGQDGHSRHTPESHPGGHCRDAGGQDAAWLLMRAEKTGKQPGGGHGGGQYPPHTHSPACPPFCNPSKGSLKLLGNSSRGTVYDWAYIYTQCLIWDLVIFLYS